MPTAEELSRFNSWLKDNGATFEDLSFSNSTAGDHSGLGVFNTGTLLTDNAIAKIPPSLLLSQSVVESMAIKGACESSRRLAKCLQGFQLKSEKTKPSRRILVAFLICVLTESRRGIEVCSNHPGSGKLSYCPNAWSPYIGILPKFDELHTPILWPADSPARQMLEATELRDAVEQKLESLNQEYNEMKAYLSELSPDVSMQDWMWADAIFWSRVLSFHSAIQHSAPNDETEGDDHHLIPLVDFCNHSFEPTIHWNYCRGVSAFPIKLELLNPGSIVNPLTELFISYGSKSNSELLFIHGFVIDKNPNNVITIPTPFVEFGFTDAEDNITPEAMNGIAGKRRLLKLLQVAPRVKIKPTMAPTPSAEGSKNDVTNALMDDDSLISMCIAVMTEDDGFSVASEQFTLHNDALPEGRKEFLNYIKSTREFPIIQLRIFTILLDILGSRLAHNMSILESGPHIDSASSQQDQVAMRIAQDYLSGECQILAPTCQRLEELQGAWVQLDSVQRYLQSMQEIASDA
ncbi:hypothetical protein DFS34DRAFT_256654 [Phlyctochytrium arcticum]|nr:hypothetical protein DFS34DRAFT_256654 [Phlyctochytrium arcticum]